MAFLEREFSEDNIKSYADICLDVTDSLVKADKERNFDTLLVPSRGAVPILVGANHALSCLAPEHRDYESFKKRLRIGWHMRGQGLPLEMITLGDDIENPINVLLFPFTADINMQKYRKDLDNDFYTNSTRAFCTEVVRALTFEEKERRKNSWLQFHLFLIGEVEKRIGLANEYEKFPKIKSMAMIDTAISGRAFTTIADNFMEKGLDPYSIVVIDKNETSLRKPYKDKMTSGIYSVATYPVSRIFTEDRGGSLEGVVGVIYPSLTFHAISQEFIEGGILSYPFGAGSWHPNPEKPQYYKVAFGLFNEMLRAAVRCRCGDLTKGINEDLERETVFRKRDDLIIFLDKYKLLRPEENLVGGFNLSYPMNKAYETSSHVVHLCFSDEISKQILADFSNYYHKKQRA